MPANGFSVGRDVSLTIFTSDGGPLATAALTNFESAPMMADIKIVQLTGELLTAYLPEGHSGSFEFTRVDSSLDDYFANAESNYYAGADIASASITETITEVDGSISIYRFEKVALKLDSPGSWAGNREVKQKVSFMASRRRKMG